MRIRLPLMLLALAVPLLAACSSNDDTVTVTQTANVRIVNASSGTPGTITGMSGTTSLGSALSFGNGASSCVAVPITSGGNTFNISNSSGTTIATTTQTLTPGGNYTLILNGTGATATPIFIDNTSSAPTSGNVMVRFVNATGTQGVVYATPASTTSLTGVNALTMSVAVGGTTSFVSTANTNTRFWLTPVGSTATTLANTGTTALVYPSGGSTTIVFLPQANASGAQFVQVNPCS